MEAGTQDKDIQAIIANMVFLLGLNSELQLADFLGVEPSAISKWKKRGSIPLKHLNLIDETLIHRANSIDAIKTINVSVQEVMDALGMKRDSRWIYQYKKKNQRLYELIEDGIRIEKIKAIQLAISMAKKS